MTTQALIQTIIEFLMIAGVAYAAFHEDALVRFERKIICNIRRRRLKVVKNHNSIYREVTYIK